MKKFLLIISALTLVLTAGAQTKESVIKGIEKAQATAENPKKATNPTTWIKLADAYVDAYTFSQGGVWIGAQAMEAKLVLKGQQVLSSEVKNYSGADYTVDTYEDKALYYNAQGLLEVIQILKPVLDS
mgnify:FL=1